MKWLVDWIAPVLIVAAGIGGAYLLERAKPEVETQVRVDAPPVVELVTAAPATGRWTVTSQGTVMPQREVRLVSEVSGRVVERADALRAGGFVEEGQVLLRLDERDYQFAVERARAEIAQARVSLVQEQAEAEIALQEWSDLGQGEPTGLALRKPQIAGAEARLAAAEAVLSQAQLDLERTHVRAPFAGRIRSERVELGQFLGRGEELCQMYGTDVAEVRLPVPDAELAALDLDLAAVHGNGPEVVLRADFAGAERSWRGRIVRTEGQIDPRTRMVHLVAEVRDPYATLEPEAAGAQVPLSVGLFVRAEILGREPTGTVEVPRIALWSADEVLVVDAEHKLWRRRVQVLRTEGQRVFIGEGLAAGERVCISPISNVIDGMPVETLSPESAR